MRRRNDHRAACTAILIALTVALTLVSCNRKTLYTHYEHTPIEGWEATDTLCFWPAPIPETALYSETVGLRTCSRYPFKELVLVVDQLIMPADTLLSDTLRCQLTDADGVPLMRGFNFYETTLPLRTVPLATGDTVILRIHHYMKREILPGIADIGVTIHRK